MIESILGIIPVRSGSKRLPGKNMMLLDGMTLLERTIRQAKKALPVSVVSTDDDKMILEALRCGVTALLRPKSLATDEATSGDVVKHVLSNYLKFDWFCLLQVTSPLRTVDDILSCIELADQSGKPVISTYKDKPNGAVYIGKVWKFDGDFWTDAIHYEMPEKRSVDIDTLEDFKRCESLL